MICHELDHLDGINMFGGNLSNASVNIDHTLEDKIKEIDEKLKQHQLKDVWNQDNMKNATLKMEQNPHDMKWKNFNQSDRVKEVTKQKMGLGQQLFLKMMEKMGKK